MDGTNKSRPMPTSGQSQVADDGETLMTWPSAWLRRGFDFRGVIVFMHVYESQILEADNINPGYCSTLNTTRYDDLGGAVDECLDETQLGASSMPRRTKYLIRIWCSGT